MNPVSKKASRKGVEEKKQTKAVEMPVEIPIVPAPAKPSRKPRRVYGPEDFKYDQPLHGGQYPRLVYRSREWFEQNHTKVRVERKDPFPEERKAERAQREALVQAGAPLAPKEKKQRVEGSTSRMGCAYNNYLNLEKHSRTGMCNFYKDYLGRKEGVTNVKAPIKCLQCGVGLHEECYYTYHQLREGVVLDLAYEINLVRSAHKTLHKWNRKMCRFHQRRVQPDVHKGVEVPGQNSQDEREKGAWEDTTEEEDPESSASDNEV